MFNSRRTVLSRSKADGRVWEMRMFGGRRKDGLRSHRDGRSQQNKGHEVNTYNLSFILLCNGLSSVLFYNYKLTC